MGQPTTVGGENWTGLLEDDFAWYECRVRPTLENVAALLASGFTWSEEARQVGVSEGGVEEVRLSMRRLAHQQWEKLRQILPRSGGK
jgi:hypothetical protein